MIFLRMAASYRRSGDLLRLRILALREAERNASGQERERLLRLIRELDGRYRDTIAAARFLERRCNRRDHSDGGRSN